MRLLAPTVDGLDRDSFDTQSQNALPYARQWIK